jgi:molybdopterin-guanine dinucleotide biosynthesis protein A
MVLASGQPGKVYVPGKRHIQDKWEDSGPLAGIEAAFSATEADVLLVLALDLPFVTRENLDLLIWSWEAPLTVARDEVGGRVQPLCGLWSRALHGPLIAYLESGRRSVMGFIEGYPYKEVDLSPESLINVNESSDLPRRNA